MPSSIYEFAQIPRVAPAEKRARASKALGALAQDSRLAVFRLLVKTGPAGMAAAQQLARARVRMDDETAEKTSRALRRRAVREAAGLPRLSLL